MGLQRLRHRLRRCSCSADAHATRHVPHAEPGGGRRRQLLLGAAWVPMWFCLDLYLQQVLGYGAFEGGAALLPMTVTIMLGMVVLAPRLSPASGSGRWSSAACCCSPAASLGCHSGAPTATSSSTCCPVARGRGGNGACVHPIAADRHLERTPGRGRTCLRHRQHQLPSRLGHRSRRDEALADRANGADQLGNVTGTDRRLPARVPRRCRHRGHRWSAGRRHTPAPTSCDGGPRRDSRRRAAARRLAAPTSERGRVVRGSSGGQVTQQPCHLTWADDTVEVAAVRRVDLKHGSSSGAGHDPSACADPVTASPTEHPGVHRHVRCACSEARASPAVRSRRLDGSSSMAARSRS